VSFVTASNVAATPAPAAPAWAQPGSPTHVQVAPPPDIHGPSKNFDIPVGIFEGQSDIGTALVPGSASYDAAIKQYTINSAVTTVCLGTSVTVLVWEATTACSGIHGTLIIPGEKQATKELHFNSGFPNMQPGGCIHE
jgi:hypothetical protein